jgi:hypothetical protein
MLQYACCALLPGSWWKRLYLFISVFASIIFWLIKKIIFLTFSPKFIINAEASHCAQDIVAIKYIFYCNKTDIQ